MHPLTTRGGVRPHVSARRASALSRAAAHRGPPEASGSSRGAPGPPTGVLPAGGHQEQIPAAEPVAAASQHPVGERRRTVPHLDARSLRPPASRGREPRRAPVRRAARASKRPAQHALDGAIAEKLAPSAARLRWWLAAPGGWLPRSGSPGLPAAGCCLLWSEGRRTRLSTRPAPNHRRLLTRAHLSVINVFHWRAPASSKKGRNLPTGPVTEWTVLRFVRGTDGSARWRARRPASGGVVSSRSQDRSPARR